MSVSKTHTLCLITLWIFTSPILTWASTSKVSTSSGTQNTTQAKEKKNSSLTDNADSEPFAPGTNNLGFEIGQQFLTGDLGNHYNDSMGWQLHYTYGVSELFSFDSSLGYSSHSDGQFSVASALAGIRTNLSYYDHLVPYSVLGMGFYRPSFSYKNAAGTGQDTIAPVLFGMHLGVGVDLLVTREIFFGTSLTYHDVIGGERDTPAGKLSTGGSYASFLLHAGYSF